jgi:hypothetical protein
VRRDVCHACHVAETSDEGRCGLSIGLGTQFSEVGLEACPTLVFCLLLRTEHGCCPLMLHLLPMERRCLLQ